VCKQPGVTRNITTVTNCLHQSQLYVFVTLKHETPWTWFSLEIFSLKNIYNCFLEGSQALPVCTSGKSNMWMRMRVEQWWNGTDRVTPKCDWKSCPSATLFTTNPVISLPRSPQILCYRYPVHHKSCAIATLFTTNPVLSLPCSPQISHVTIRDPTTLTRPVAGNWQLVECLNFKGSYSYPSGIERQSKLHGEQAPSWFNGL